MRWTLPLLLLGCNLVLDLEGPTSVTRVERPDAEPVEVIPFDGSIGSRDASADAAPEPDIGPGPDMGCPPGTEDRGEGRCVPTDECEPGFVRPYLDGDQDGVGGERVDQCTAVDALPDGQVVEGGDCDDADAQAWRAASAHFDADGDGYTTGPELACVGAALPDRAFARASPPPTPSFEAARVEADPDADEPWERLEEARRPDNEGARCDGDEGACGVLRFVDFGLRVPNDAEITGIAVHVRRRARGLNNAGGVDRSVRLASGEALSPGDRAGEGAWLNQWHTASYGGAQDLWGRPWTPAEVNAANFALLIEASPEEGLFRLIDIDHVWIEVFHDRGSDCDDADPERWSALVGFVDADEDGFGGRAPLTACAGAALPERVAQHGGDCYDDGAAARPDADGYHTAHRGDGSYDYDCDGRETPGRVMTDNSCNADANGDCQRSTLLIENPAPCGQANAVRRCAGAEGVCQLEDDNALTPCR